LVTKRPNSEQTKEPMTIAVDVTYTVLAHDISPDRRIRANSCNEISKYNELVPARYMHTWIAASHSSDL